MDDILKTFIEQNHLPQWIIGLIIALWILIAAAKWIFSENKTWLTPFESRKREKYNFLKEISKDENDNVIKEVVDEIRKADIFFEHTNIRTNSQLEREKLLEIYKLANPRYGWSAIREAYPSLVKNSNGDFKPGVHIVDHIFMVVLIIGSIIIFLSGLAFYISSPPINFNSDEKSVWRVFQMISFVFTTILAMAFFNPAVPTIRALQLSRYIPEPPLNTQTSEAQPQQNS